MSKVFGPLLTPGQPIDKTALAAALDNRLLIAFATAADVQTWTAGTPSPDATQGVFVALLGVYSRDDADTTSAHDGISVLVSADGVRFKNAVMVETVNVRRSDLTTPPSSPSIGDGYLLIGAPSGAWAGQQDSVAVWTALGWQYIPPSVGMIVYVQDDDAWWRYTAAAQWELGLGLTQVAEGSIGFRSLQYPAGLIVLDVLNDPPSSPTAGDLYVVGTSPTGDWSGRENQLALREASAWAFVTAANGWRVWDRGSVQLIYFSGSAWLPVVDAAYLGRKYFSATGGSGPPVVPNTTGTEVAAVTYAITTPGNKVMVTAKITLASTSGAETAGCFFDEETNARLIGRTPASHFDLFIFGEITPGDAQEHVYKFRTTGTFQQIDVELIEARPSS